MKIADNMSEALIEAADYLHNSGSVANARVFRHVANHSTQDTLHVLALILQRPWG